MLDVYPRLYVVFVVSPITSEINLKTQSVPRSKHNLRLGYKNMSVNAV